MAKPSRLIAPENEKALVAISIKIDEFWIKHDEVYTKNDEFCIKNDGIVIQMGRWTSCWKSE